MRLSARSGSPLVAGRQLRLDTTVVETNIHYPTDSSLLSDGGAGVDAHHEKMQRLAGQAGTKLRDRSRSVKHRLIEIGRASRDRQNRERFEKACRKLLRNWAGERLDSYQKILHYARTTTTKTGLRVSAYLDRRYYPRGRKPTPQQIASLRLQRHETLPQWNYTIKPQL